MTFQQYLSEVNKALYEYRSWRIGQAYFNVLHRVRPTLANHIRATRLDPFYLNTPLACQSFLDWLERHWNDEAIEAKETGATGQGESNDSG